MENFYEILGVAETATFDDIKSQYRKLAKKYHPDQNPGDAAAELQFKNISSAYDTLGNPDKRARYDQERKFSNMGGGFNPQGFAGGGFNTNQFGGMNIDDIFNQIFGGHPGFRAAQKNRDLNFNLTINLKDAFDGKVVPLKFVNPTDNKEVELNVQIPPGIDSGARMRFAGYGDRSIANLSPGDLYISITVAEHPQLRRNGPHLHQDLSVSAVDCMLGCDHNVECLDGQYITVKIPPGCQQGTVLRVKGKGMPVNNGQHGDLLLTINVHIPHLNEQQQVVCNQLRSLMVPR
jgi:DnaJ-class molecular chaperone